MAPKNKIVVYKPISQEIPPQNTLYEYKTNSEVNKVQIVKHSFANGVDTDFYSVPDNATFFLEGFVFTNRTAGAAGDSSLRIISSSIGEPYLFSINSTSNLGITTSHTYITPIALSAGTTFRIVCGHADVRNFCCINGYLVYQKQ